MNASENRHRRELENLLNEEHRSLEATFERLFVKFQAGDRDAVRECWLRLDSELRGHLHDEETLMLPSFQRFDPKAVARIREEHAKILHQLEQLGIDLDLHSLSRRSAEAFRTMLQKHAQYEQKVFYPWVAAHVTADARHVALRRLLEVLQHASPETSTATRSRSHVE